MRSEVRPRCANHDRPTPGTSSSRRRIDESSSPGLAGRHDRGGPSRAGPGSARGKRGSADTRRRRWAERNTRGEKASHGTASRGASLHRSASAERRSVSASVSEVALPITPRGPLRPADPALGMAWPPPRSRPRPLRDPRRARGNPRGGDAPTPWFPAMSVTTGRRPAAIASKRLRRGIGAQDRSNRRHARGRAREALALSTHPRTRSNPESRPRRREPRARTRAGRCRRGPKRNALPRRRRERADERRRVVDRLELAHP